MKIAIINGPNINMLGKRDKSQYGQHSYNTFLKVIDDYCTKQNIKYEHFQSNSEGDIITYLQSLYEKVDGIVINPASYTHTSIGILDILLILKCIKVEVHLSDIANREDFRKVSITSNGCNKQIKGLGIDGYIEAIKYIEKCVKNENN